MSICVDGGAVSGSIELVARVSGWRPDGDDLVAAGVLGFVQRAVGPADQPLRAFLAVPFGNPGRERLAVRVHRAEIVEDHDRLDGRAVAQQDGELLTAVAG